MDAKIFRINYKSDFILTLHSDAGWATPFCIKFWTGAPSQAYYAGWDGTTYTHCAADGEDPTKLTVQFDDHHLPVGNLKYQIAYHFACDDFPDDTEDEVTNVANVTTDINGEEYQVMLDFSGEMSAVVIFNLPAMAAEAQRQQNELQRIANELNRINQETIRVGEFATLKAQAESDHQVAVSDHTQAESDHQVAVSDHTQAESDHQVAVSDHTASEAATQSVNQAIARVNTLVENTDALLGAEDVPAFSTSVSYSIGDYVMYDGKLYKFTQAHAAGGWVGTDAVETNLFLEVDEMKRQDYEHVIIECKTEGGTAIANVEVLVTVEGESSARNLTTDSSGRCTTNVEKGLEYTVDANDITGYYAPQPILKRASLATRLVEVVYIEEDEDAVEHVRISVGYTDSDLPQADWVKVNVAGTDYQLTLVNNVAEIDIPLGDDYIVTFQDIAGYSTPVPRRYRAEYHGTRPINAVYTLTVDSYMWLMSDGRVLPLNSVTEDDRVNGEIFGLIVQTSDLSSQGCSYVIPIDYFLSSNSPMSGNWLSAQVSVTGMSNFGSHATALGDVDGEQNCMLIRQFIADKKAQGTTYTSTIAQNTYNTRGGYSTFMTGRRYSAGRYVLYDGKIYQFTSNHAANTAWNPAEVNLIFDTFDANTAYNIGDKVVYNNILYEFISAHTVGYVWSASEVEVAGWLMPDLAGGLTKVVRHGFTPAYGQLFRYKEQRGTVSGDTRTGLTQVTYALFGIDCLNVASGNWWSSTQSNAQVGVYMVNGQFFNNGKNNSYSVLPVLAY